VALPSTGSCLARLRRALTTFATTSYAKGEHCPHHVGVLPKRLRKSQLLRYLEAVELRGVLAHQLALVGFRHFAEFAGQDFL